MNLVICFLVLTICSPSFNKNERILPSHNISRKHVEDVYLQKLNIKNVN